jgi:hypothetical protein
VVGSSEAVVETIIMAALRVFEDIVRRGYGMKVVMVIESGRGADFMSLEMCGVTPTISVYELGL